MPLEGILENCRLDTAKPVCDQRLGVMHAGGSRIVVVPAWSGSLPALMSYAANAHLLAFLAHWLGALRGTYGYYAAEDSMLSPWDRDGVPAYVSNIKRADPRDRVLIRTSSQA